MSTHPRIADKILSAPVGVTAACLTLAIMMGCLSLEIGNRTIKTPPCEEGVLCQEGEAHVPANSSQLIRYPLPYPRKPNVEISSTFDDCLIDEEREDGFLLRNPNCFSRTVTWKARGVKYDPPLAAPSAPPPPIAIPATTPTLPAPTPEHPTDAQ